MAMTLRTEPADDAALTRLARHYGVSKQRAALLAVQETDARVSGNREIDALIEGSLDRWGAVYEALART